MLRPRLLYLRDMGTQRLKADGDGNAISLMGGMKTSTTHTLLKR
ncbi:hypothetical protein XGA_3321 [Xanthomonas hortorum ATCC 19865]|nr:hypothetical protein XGA_3321 [Xanthomonas hortorum ATCC 19865]